MVFPPNTPPPGGGEDETLDNANPHFPGNCCDPGDVLCYWNLTQNPDPVEYTSLSPNSDILSTDFSNVQKMLQNSQTGNLIGRDYNPLLDGGDDMFNLDSTDWSTFSFDSGPVLEFMQDGVDFGNSISDAWEDTYFGGTDDGKAIVKGVQNLVVGGVSAKRLLGEIVDSAPVQDFVGRVSDDVNDWLVDRYGSSGANLGASVSLSRIPLNDMVTVNFSAYYKKRKCLTLASFFDDTWYQINADVSTGYWVGLQAVIPVDGDLYDAFASGGLGFDARAALAFPGIFGDPEIFLSAPLVGWDSEHGFIEPGSFNAGFSIFNYSWR